MVGAKYGFVYELGSAMGQMEHFVSAIGFLTFCPSSFVMAPGGKLKVRGIRIDVVLWPFVIVFTSPNAV